MGLEQAKGGDEETEISLQTLGGVGLVRKVWGGEGVRRSKQLKVRKRGNRRVR